MHDIDYLIQNDITISFATLQTRCFETDCPTSLLYRTLEQFIQLFVVSSPSSSLYAHYVVANLIVRESLTI
jgi:hypothetical protein